MIVSNWSNQWFLGLTKLFQPIRLNHLVRFSNLDSAAHAGGSRFLGVSIGFFAGVGLECFCSQHTSSPDAPDDSNREHQSCDQRRVSEADSAGDEPPAEKTPSKDSAL